MLIDALDRGCGGRDLDANRITQKIGGERCNLLRHCRREEQVLPFLRQQGGNPPDGVDEA